MTAPRRITGITTCPRCNQHCPRKIYRHGNITSCLPCLAKVREAQSRRHREEFIARRREEEKRGHEETDADLDRLIAAQMENLPKWWHNSKAFMRGD